MSQEKNISISKVPNNNQIDPNSNQENNIPVSKTPNAI